jgi:hypothetical protein
VVAPITEAVVEVVAPVTEVVVKVVTPVTETVVEVIAPVTEMATELVIPASAVVAPVIVTATAAAPSLTELVPMTGTVGDVTPLVVQAPSVVQAPVRVIEPPVEAAPSATAPVAELAVPVTRTEPRPRSLSAAPVSEAVTHPQRPGTQSFSSPLQAPAGSQVGAVSTPAQSVALSAVLQAEPLSDTVPPLTVTPVTLEDRAAAAVQSPRRATAPAVVAPIAVIGGLNADCESAAGTTLVTSWIATEPTADHRAARQAAGTTPGGPAPVPSAPRVPAPVAAPAMVSGLGSPGQPLAVLNHHDFGAITSADRFAAGDHTVPRSRAALVRIWPG